jgi:hypothetical protein
MPELPFDTEGGCHGIVQVIERGPGWVVFRPGIPARPP